MVAILFRGGSVDWSKNSVILSLITFDSGVKLYGRFIICLIQVPIIWPVHHLMTKNYQTWFLQSVFGYQYIFAVMCLPFWPQRVNSLLPTDTICNRSGSPSDQVMACCLMASSHSLIRCLLIVRSVLQHSPESNFTKSAHKLPKHVFGDCSFKITITAPRGQWVMQPSTPWLKLFALICYND